MEYSGGENRSAECSGETKRNIPGRGSSCPLDSPSFSDSIPSFPERTGMGENAPEAAVFDDEAATSTSPSLRSFITCAWKYISRFSASCLWQRQRTNRLLVMISELSTLKDEMVKILTPTKKGVPPHTYRRLASQGRPCQFHQCHLQPVGASRIRYPA